MKRRSLTMCTVASLLIWSAGADAQEANGDAAAAPGRFSKAIAWTASAFDGAEFTRDGFHPSFGDLISGSGPSVGSGYRLHLFGRRAIIDLSGEISTRRYMAAQSSIVWPEIAGGKMSLGAQVKYADFTQVNFFGIGSQAQKGDQTDYRLRYIDVGGFAMLPMHRGITVTAGAGALRGARVSGGTSTLVPAVAERFDEETAPGLVRQPNYLHADVTIE